MRQSLRRLVAAFAAASLAGSSACRAYQPTGGVVPAGGERVRLQLTDSGSVALASYLGPRVAAVRGRVASSDDHGDLALRISVVETPDGETVWKGESVSIPRRFVALTEVERVSAWRSALAAGALGALVFAVARSLSGSASSGGRSGEPGGTTK